jgi:hypothetical protein
MGREIPKDDPRPTMTKIKEATASAEKFIGKDAAGVGPVGRLVNSLTDALDVSAPLKRLFAQHLREALPATQANDMLVAVNGAQVHHASNVATHALDEGGIKYDPSTHKSMTVASKYNRGELYKTYKTLSEALGMPLTGARYIASTALESKRTLALMDMRDRMLQEAANLKAQSDAAKAAGDALLADKRAARNALRFTGATCSTGLARWPIRRASERRSGAWRRRAGAKAPMAAGCRPNRRCRPKT